MSNMIRWRGVWLLIGGLLALVWGGALAQAAEPPVQPTSVQALVKDGRHNAFTALTRWRDRLWLAYRSGKDHNSHDGEIVLHASRDGQDWPVVQRFNVNPDDRDPAFLITEDRLILFAPGMDGAKLTNYALWTTDGETWSEPRTVYLPQFIVWKPFRHGDHYLASAHRKAEGKEGGKVREVHLIRSPNGLDWEKISTIRAGNWESETTVMAGPGEKLTAFLRTKYSVPGQILEASPPYAEWTPRPAGVHFSGHCVHHLRGTTYLLSRTMTDDAKTMGTMIYTYENGELEPYCRLPAGGDCSYPEVIVEGDQMLISYYSSHEGSTNIYLARVPLRGK